MVLFAQFRKALEMRQNCANGTTAIAPEKLIYTSVGLAWRNVQRLQEDGSVHVDGAGVQS